jgi:hypothetical protein
LSNQVIRGRIDRFIRALPDFFTEEFGSIPTALLEGQEIDSSVHHPTLHCDFQQGTVSGWQGLVSFFFEPPRMPFHIIVKEWSSEPAQKAVSFGTVLALAGYRTTASSMIL